jgi:hypothetical protein
LSIWLLLVEAAGVTAVAVPVDIEVLLAEKARGEGQAPNLYSLQQQELITQLQLVPEEREVRELPSMGLAALIQFLAL